MASPFPPTAIRRRPKSHSLELTPFKPALHGGVFEAPHRERRPRGTRPSLVARLLESRAGPALIGHDHVSYPGEPVSLLAQAEGMSVPHPPIVVRMPCRAGGVAHVRVKVWSSDRSPGLNLLHRPWELAAVVRARPPWSRYAPQWSTSCSPSSPGRPPKRCAGLAGADVADRFGAFAAHPTPRAEARLGRDACCSSAASAVVKVASTPAGLARQVPSRKGFEEIVRFSSSRSVCSTPGPPVLNARSQTS